MSNWKHLSLAVLLIVVSVGFADHVAADNGLPLPRFVSLRAGEVYMRAGPGMQYPVKWVYRRLGLPVEVVAEYHEWRRVRDPESETGWIHSSMLSGRRNILVSGDGQSVSLRATSDLSSPAIAAVEPGAVGRILKCPAPSWCRVDFGPVRGWLPREDLWGLYPDETLD